MDEWDAEQSLAEVPEDIRRIFMSTAMGLLGELERKFNQSGLTHPMRPAKDPFFIRYMMRRNPEWYSMLYHGHSHSPTTGKSNFKRQRCIAALTRIAEARDKRFRIRPYVYDYKCRDFLFEALTGSHYENGRYVEPTREVCEYFGIRYDPEGGQHNDGIFGLKDANPGSDCGKDYVPF